MPRTACPRIKRNRAKLALATDITHTFLGKLQFRFYPEWNSLNFGHLYPHLHQTAAA